MRLLLKQEELWYKWRIKLNEQKSVHINFTYYWKEIIQVANMETVFDILKTLAQNQNEDSRIIQAQKR